MPKQPRLFEMPRRYSNEQIIQAYRDTGSIWKAAKKLGCVGQSVWERLKALDYPMANTAWTAEELAELQQLAGQNTITEIAQRLGRPYAGVAGKISELGLSNRYGKPWCEKDSPGEGLHKRGCSKVDF